MLPALASGLREGGRFDVLTLPFGDAGASAAAQRADALAVFYGMPERPLQTALQALAPAVRGRGGRVVAVLQREQAAQRDECFKAGAGGLPFMPMPKEQVVGRPAAAGRARPPRAGAGRAPAPATGDAALRARADARSAVAAHFAGRGGRRWTAGSSSPGFRGTAPREGPHSGPPSALGAARSGRWQWGAARAWRRSRSGCQRGGPRRAR